MEGSDQVVESGSEVPIRFIKGPRWHHGQTLDGVTMLLVAAVLFGIPLLAILAAPCAVIGALLVLSASGGFGSVHSVSAKVGGLLLAMSCVVGAFFAGLAGGLNVAETYGASWSETFHVVLLGYALVSIGFGASVVGLVGVLEDKTGRALLLAAFFANVAGGLVLLLLYAPFVESYVLTQFGRGLAASPTLSFDAVVRRAPLFYLPSAVLYSVSLFRLRKSLRSGSRRIAPPPTIENSLGAP